ncbi:MAG: hypothetical protein KAH20_16515 [Methylococcales bacterium]|nr:hypothetical protein [Methylococcales bacterium]
MNTLYITGAGVSAESGIPTFRGKDGYWTIGSKNYAPEEMATRAMYENNPVEFLSWYYHRFASYRNYKPNSVHQWLSDKNLITQNIDGLDGKAGNTNYIAIHGRLDQMTLFHDQNNPDIDIITTPWDSIDEENVVESLLDLFQITGTPKLNKSFKPYVLLFDEIYTELYRISEAQQRMYKADRIIFIGTSFSVNITEMALSIAFKQKTPIEIVDLDPINPPLLNAKIHKMEASTYVDKIKNGELF